MEYNKLVRDKIPEIIREKGAIPKIHVASEEEYGTKLREKLSEEVQEYLEDPCIEELADILEVVYALCSLKGISKKKLEKVREKKVFERGGFEQKIILESTNN